MLLAELCSKLGSVFSCTGCYCDRYKIRINVISRYALPLFSCYLTTLNLAIVHLSKASQ